MLTDGALLEKKDLERATQDEEYRKKLFEELRMTE